MGKRELVALLNLSSWCLVVVDWLFHAVPQGCLRFVILVFPDHTHLQFFMILIALFKKFLSLQFFASIEVSNIARCSSQTNELRDMDSIGCRARNIIM